MLHVIWKPFWVVRHFMCSYNGSNYTNGVLGYGHDRGGHVFEVPLEGSRSFITCVLTNGRVRLTNGETVTTIQVR